MLPGRPAAAGGTGLPPERSDGSSSLAVLLPPLRGRSSAGAERGGRYVWQCATGASCRGLPAGTGSSSLAHGAMAGVNRPSNVPRGRSRCS
eukprot:3962702-Prymnesium_polylepis.1